MQNTDQEIFLNDTLVMAWFNPNEDDFDLLKQDMRPILEEFIELNLYSLLSEEDKSIYDKLPNKSLKFFEDRISNFDNILSWLYIDRQKEYLANLED